MDSSGHPSGPSELWAQLPIGQLVDFWQNRIVCSVSESQRDIWLVEFDGAS